MDLSKPDDLSPATVRGHVTGAHPPIGPGSPRPKALTSAPDALGLLNALRRRLALAVGLGLVVAAVAGPAAWFLVPAAKYTATATMYMSMNPKRIVFEPQGERTDPRVYQKTQEALLKDRYILSHALSNPEVSGLPMIKDLLGRKGDPEEWLKDRLKVTFPGGSEVLEVSLSGDRPNDLAKVVNAVIQSYMTLIVDEEQKERLRRLEQLESLWDKYQKDLKIKREALEEVAANVGSDNKDEISLSRQFKASQLALIQSELMRVNHDVLKSQAELKALGKEDGASPRAAPASAPASAVEEQVGHDSGVIALKGRMDDVARKYWEVDRVTRAKSDPALQSLARRWQAAKKDLDAQRARVREEVGRGAAVGAAGGGGARPPLTRAQEVARLKVALDVLNGYKQAMEEGEGRLQRDIKNLGKGGLYVEDKRDEISIANEFARKVGAELEYVRVEMKGPPRIKILAAAKAPKLKDELRNIKVGGAAALGSLAVALFGVSLWEFQARRVNSPDDVVNGLGMRLIGSLPALASAGRPGAPRAQRDVRLQARLVESVDAMRTLLLHTSRSDSVRVVMVASAVKGEGKTSLSCHLATSLARAGRKTVLVDGDLRSPVVHRMFGEESSPGLCEYLRGESSADEIIRGTSAKDLDLIPAGRCDPLALQGLSRDGLGSLLGGLRASYDFVIVDTAPVLPVNDTLLICQHCDGVLFSVLREVSRLPAVYAACERLSVLGVRILGAVVSGVPGGSYGTDTYPYAKTAAEARSS